MSYPTAAGVPVLAGYTPKKYSPKLLRKFYAECVIPAISNTEYEGEIKNQGDEVVIRTCPDIEINDHVKGQVLVNQRPSPNTVSLLIDKGKSWSFVTEDIDQAQTDLKRFVEDWTTNASKRMAISIDTLILGQLYALVDTANQGATAGAVWGSYNMGTTGSPIAITKSNAMDYLSHCASVLDEQNIPRDGERHIVLPVWFTNCLARSELRQAQMMGDSMSVARKGQDKLGEFDGFTIWRSNLYTSVTDTNKTCCNVYFGHKSALTFASQLTKNEVIQNPFGFGWLHRGLQVFGYKMPLPKAAGNLYCYNGAESIQG